MDVKPKLTRSKNVNDFVLEVLEETAVLENNISLFNVTIDNLNEISS